MHTVTVGIIGPGKVGTTLGILAKKSSRYNVIVGGRNPEKARAAAEQIDRDTKFCGIDEAASESDIVLLTVPDDCIETISNELAENGSFSDKTIVAHCSGALSSDVLHAAYQKCGSSIASMHPLQTFPDIESALTNVSGTFCYYEGSSSALAILKEFIIDIGFNPVAIDKKSKVLYHATAVFACNYLSSLMDAALETGMLAGIDKDIMWKSLSPLVHATISNIEKNGPEAALTGPIARGDINTVMNHLKSLEENCDGDRRLSVLYAVLGIQTVDLAVRKGNLSKEKALQLIRELEKILFYNRET